MSTLNIVRRCYGCGAILQGEDPSKEGYIAPRLLSSNLDTILFCDKCYNEERFNQQPHPLTAGQGFLTMLSDAAASDALIVYVVDLFSFECSFVREVNETIKNSPLLVIANKRDLLPSSAKDDDLREYVAHRFRAARLKVKAEDVVLASLSESMEDQDYQALIDQKRRAHDVYVIGAQKAGKTIFLQTFLRHYVNRSNRNIVTKNYPGTDLRLLEIPLDGSSSIYDTPGTPLNNTLPAKLETGAGFEFYPTIPVAARKEQLSAGDSLFIGGVARIDLLKTAKKGRQEVRLYFGDKVRTKKVGALRHPDAEFADVLVKKSLLPSSKLFNSPKDFDVYEVDVEEEGRRDIGIAGLGWISFLGDGQKFNVYVPHGVDVYTSRAKIK